MNIKTSTKWLKEDILLESKKYCSKIEWLKNSSQSYYAAYKNGWIEEASTHMKRPKSHKAKWFKENVLLEAKKYQHKQQWRIKSSGSYNVALKNKWIGEASAHMTTPDIHNKKWFKENVLLEAKKYISKVEWTVKSSGSFQSAYRNGWIEEASAHMKSHKGACEAETEILKLVRKYYPNAKTKRFPNKDSSFSFKRLEIDIYIPELNKGIEFDGTYWHSVKSLRKHRKHWKEEEIQHYHEIKDAFFKKQGIELMHVLENTWNSSKNECLDAILMFIGV